LNTNVVVMISFFHLTITSDAILPIMFDDIKKLSLSFCTKFWIISSCFEPYEVFNV
jgi:hypothetical protein